MTPTAEIGSGGRISSNVSWATGGLLNTPSHVIEGGPGDVFCWNPSATQREHSMLSNRETLSEAISETRQEKGNSSD
jgi:hypothetical protein